MSLMKSRKLFSLPVLIPAAIVIAAAATAVLFRFPESVAVWQAATWTLVAALVALLALVLASAYVLARKPAARTWPRVVACLLGLGCLVAVALAAL